jgi:hypothetical protein
VLAFAVPAASSCSAGDSSDQPSFDDKVAAADSICPIMWQWVKDVGAAFNGAAGDVAGIDAPRDRRDRWYDGFDEMESLNLALLADTTLLADDPVLTPLLVDINSGVVTSLAEIDDLRALLRDTPEVDAERHQARTQQLIVRVEKVIDVVKPELAEYGDPDLIAAFRGVPSCQHSIKDADDGTPRANE